MSSRVSTGVIDGVKQFGSIEDFFYGEVIERNLFLVFESGPRGSNITRPLSPWDWVWQG